MWAILNKEIHSFLSSLIAYIFIGSFLIFMGLMVWVLPGTSLLETGLADLDPLFSWAPYVFLMLIPAVTMRSIAEEKRTGTIELLLTKPVPLWQILLGKYFGCFALVLLSLIPTVVYYFSVYQLGAPKGNIDSAAYVGSMLGLVLLGGIYVAIGILASSLTSNQIIAFSIAIIVSFVLYKGLADVAAIPALESIADVLSNLSISRHYLSISRGVIDLRDVLYFLSVIVLMLSGAHLALKQLKK